MAFYRINFGIAFETSVLSQTHIDFITQSHLVIVQLAIRGHHLVDKPDDFLSCL